MKTESLIRVTLVKEVNEQKKCSELPGNQDIHYVEKGIVFLGKHSRLGFKTERKDDVFGFMFWDPIEALDKDTEGSIMYDLWFIPVGKLDTADQRVSKIQDQFLVLKNCSLVFPNSLQELEITFVYPTMEDMRQKKHSKVHIRTSSDFGNPITIE